MIARLIDFALTQRLLLLLFMTLLIGGSAYAVKEIPNDAIPEFPNTKVNDNNKPS